MEDRSSGIMRRRMIIYPFVFLSFLVEEEEEEQDKDNNEEEKEEDDDKEG